MTAIELALENAARLDELIRLLLKKGVITSQERLEINRYASTYAEATMRLQESDDGQDD